MDYRKWITGLDMMPGFTARRSGYRIADLPDVRPQLARADAAKPWQQPMESDAGVKQRIPYFDFMRGLTVILVVMFHACCWGYLSESQVPALYVHFNAFLANIRMPVLMMISGYLIKNIARKERREVMGRIAQLMWLYALWMPVNLVAHVVAAGDQTGIADLCGKMILEWINPTSEMWFIWSLVIFTGLAYALRDVPKHVIIILLVVGNGLTYQFEWFANQLAAASMPRMAMFFFGGIFFHQQINRLVASPFRWGTLLTLMTGTVGFHYSESVIHEGLGIYVFQGLETVLVSLTIMYLCRMLTWSHHLVAVFGKIGRNTLPIYLAHVPMILLARGAVLGWEGAGAYLAPVVLVAAGVGGGLLLHRIAGAAGGWWLYRRPNWFDARYAYAFLSGLRDSAYRSASIIPYR
ncbi:hypothetical protein GCM10022268_02270 [Sphingomonas cynarae]|uniref:Acyltransferase 3 domain-containing protein n=1 Tax=Sphingomonas cynarae TaxID=930197 RepID=A0ABP7CR69_9SPHN